MALFIVLITVLVLTIVIFQLTFTTKVEERISQNRQGFLEMNVALLAVARSGIMALETDLMEDFGYATEEGTEEESATPAPPGPSPDPGEEEGEKEEEHYDTRHEGWAHLQNEQVNDVRVELRILDGEGRLDLNHLFEYAQRPEEEEESEEPPEGPPGAPGEPEEPLPEEEEYVPPTPEEIEDAELVLSRLIEALILSNQESGFDYLDDLPDPQLAAREIVAWVSDRQSEPETRLIRSLEELRAVDGVTWELFHGPTPAEDEEKEGDDESDPLASLAEEFGEMPGFEQTDEGVLEIARPLGLRDLLTTHSTGKVNLNTARPEVLAALLLGFEDIEEAREIALQIDTHLNSYAIEDEEEAGTPAGEETAGETEGQEFNEFKSFEDVGKVDETWSEGSASEPSVLDLIRESLEPVSAFRSTFFTLQLKAEREDRTLSGTMQAVRQDHDIIVISWEESDR